MCRLFAVAFGNKLHTALTFYLLVCVLVQVDYVVIGLFSSDLQRLTPLQRALDFEDVALTREQTKEEKAAKSARAKQMNEALTAASGGQVEDAEYGLTAALAIRSRVIGSANAKGKVKMTRTEKDAKKHKDLILKAAKHLLK